ncbi:hypothetical protein C5688_05725 [Methylocystis sp. MitZ-2018]|nr:hypothetical protein C5688_05725 [Methylocystis sp. MitZ-2018]
MSQQPNRSLSTVSGRGKAWIDPVFEAARFCGQHFWRNSPRTLRGFARCRNLNDEFDFLDLEGFNTAALNPAIQAEPTDIDC